MAFREREVLCAGAAGLHRMAYAEWGDADNPRVLICVHGLTRCGRDFDFLAERLSAHYRVVCPDVAGRGRSDWLADPAGYALPQYLADMVTLIARLDVPQVHWLGTSMGGLIGMLLASQAKTPIGRLVLNDVGPTMEMASLRRIGEYVGRDPAWDSFDEALACVRRINASFGDLDEAQWRALTEPTVAQRADGRWSFVYDPRIGDAFRAAVAGSEVDLWPLYERIACPTLAVRGADSDLLAPATWRQMAERGPRARLAEIAGVGHAPTFLDAAQVDVVADFLLAA